MVNVVAPFVMTRRLLASSSNTAVKRIVTTSAMMHKDCGLHAKALDYDNLQFEKGDWKFNQAYALSKLLVIMMSRGFFYHGSLPKDTTMLTFHPGAINTKMLLSAFGKVGMDIEKSDETFQLAVDDKFNNPGQLPKYYFKLEEKDPAPQACDETACLKFFEYMDQITKD